MIHNDTYGNISSHPVDTHPGETSHPLRGRSSKCCFPYVSNRTNQTILEPRNCALNESIYYKGFLIKQKGSIYTVHDHAGRLCWEAQECESPDAIITAIANPVAFRIVRDAKDWIDDGCPLPEPLVHIFAHTREDAEQQLLKSTQMPIPPQLEERGEKYAPINVFGTRSHTLTRARKKWRWPRRSSPDYSHTMLLRASRLA